MGAAKWPGEGRRPVTVEIHPRYLDLIRSKVGWTPGARIGLADLAQRLTRAVSRPAAFHHSTVERFLKGTQVTDEILFAFCELLKMPYPVVALEDPALAAWLEAGRVIREKKPDYFRQALVMLGGVAYHEQTGADLFTDFEAFVQGAKSKTSK
jgi:hypothetical protein